MNKNKASIAFFVQFPRASSCRTNIGPLYNIQKLKKVKFMHPGLILIKLAQFSNQEKDRNVADFVGLQFKKAAGCLTFK